MRWHWFSLSHSFSLYSLLPFQNDDKHQRSLGSSCCTILHQTFPSFALIPVSLPPPSCARPIKVDPGFLSGFQGSLSKHRSFLYFSFFSPSPSPISFNISLSVSVLLFPFCLTLSINVTFVECITINKTC